LEKERERMRERKMAMHRVGKGERRNKRKMAK
jgi:hypothetical protein